MENETERINCDIILITFDMVQAQWLNGNTRTFEIQPGDDVDITPNGNGTETVYLISYDVAITARNLIDA